MFTPLKDALRTERAQTLPRRFSLLHVLGSLALFFLLIEILSGILLLAYYRPTATDAFHSMGVIIDEVRFGWLVHSVHTWSAHLLIFLALVYLVFMFFSHAYQTPRRMTWATAVLLLCLMFAFSFTGGLLPWDQYAFWSTEVVRRTIAGIPVLGPALLYLWWGGWTIGEEVLLRFYVIHVAVLPWVGAGLLSFHLYLVWRYGVADAPAGQRRRPSAPLREFLTSVLIFVLLLSGALVTLATVAPPPLAPRADPLQPLAAVAPPWYFTPVDQLLRHLPSGIGALAVIGVFVLLFMPPVIDGRPVQSTWRKILRWTLGMLAIAACLLLGIEGYLS